jgi:transglutaminase-like putative cysteine protease
MKSKHNLPIRVISIIVLFFFCWSFAGGFDVAYAIKNSDKLQVASNKLNTSQQSSASADQPMAGKPEEKFEKTLTELEQILTDTSTDTDTKKNKLKNKKSEIEGLDVEIKKQFSNTEKKLKDEGLPNEILQRHYDFVKKYDDNLNELKNNLDAIDKAKDKKEADNAIEKTKKFLEKVKPPKKYVPLDPNKLPHRTAEPVWIEPRTNPEEFSKDSQESAVASRQSKPILIASNGPLTGLLNSPSPETNDLQPILLAQASNPPTDADLAETIEVKFTPAIQAKAQELGNNPVKIYNWVRNSIEFVPTYGSIQGADMCLQTKQCNDSDTASLLIALLRASGIHARYVYGTIEIPIEKIKNWLGGFTDSMEALRLLASAKIPTKGMTVGGEIKYARIEHVWVEAWIDYIPSRGARHKTGQGDTWIPLDASFKQYNYTQGIDIQSAVPFDAQSFIDQIQATATINETEGYVTSVDSLFIQQTMTDYQTQVENYINENYPDATVGDVLGKKEIIKQEFSYLLGTLPYKRIVTGAKYSSISDNLRHKINFNVIKDMYDEIIGTPINITKNLPELAGKKITLSYSPATQADEDVINSYLPKPHADGTPIDPSELPTSLPAYLINLKPELRIDGVVVATGTAVGMGNTETFKMTFTAPNESADVIMNQIEAGEYLGIALDLGRISQEQMTALKAKLEATKAKLEAQDFINLTKDDILGDLLYATALSYYAELNVLDYVLSKTIGVTAIRLPSETIFSFELKRIFAFGIPMSISPGGLGMDVDRLMTLAKVLDGNQAKPKQFFLASGMNSSTLEHSVPEQLFSTTENPAQGISAVKALKIANDQGIPIYKINQTNINTIFPQLQVDSYVKADIQNAVNAGKEVTVSKMDITFNGWTGCGYIIVDPVTGVGAYMISGGMNGGILLITLGIILIIIGIALCAGPVPAGIAAIALGLYYYFYGFCLLYDDPEFLKMGLGMLITGSCAACIPITLIGLLIVEPIVAVFLNIAILCIQEWLDDKLKEICT